MNKIPFVDLYAQYLSIKEGPFTGFCCEVIQCRGKQKILVRIELLQRNVLMDMPVESLMPAISGYTC